MSRNTPLTFKCLRLFKRWLVCAVLFSGVSGANHRALSPKAGPEFFAGHKVLRIFNEYNSPIVSPAGISSPVVYQDRSRRYWIGGSGYPERILLYEEDLGQWTILGSESEDSSNLRYRGGAILPSEIKMIGQSKDGRMWFSSGQTNMKRLRTQTVLSSFDGQKWEAHAISLEAHDASDRYETVFRGLFVGPDGDAWFWANERLTRYDGERWKEFYLNTIFKTLSGKTLHPGSLDILCGVEDRRGTIWLVTGEGVLTYEKRTNTWGEIPKIGRFPGGKVYIDRSGRLWISNGFTVLCYDPRSRSSSEYDLIEHINRPDLNCLLAGIYQDREDRMLFVFDDGVLVFSESKGNWVFTDTRDFADARITQIMEDRAGRLWLAMSSAIAVLAP
jgi:ligand-binding sensor domain-containing protein